MIYLSLHCHHQNDSCIKMGSDESHFNVSLIVSDKVTRQCPQTTTFEEKGKPKRIRNEVPLLTSLLLGQTGSRTNAWINFLNLGMNRPGQCDCQREQVRQSEWMKVRDLAKNRHVRQLAASETVWMTERLFAVKGPRQCGCPYDEWAFLQWSSLTASCNLFRIRHGINREIIGGFILMMWAGLA